MKKILSFICVLFFFAAVQAQTPTTVNNSDQQIYKEVEVLATFPGGLAEMHKFFGTKATIGKFGEPGTEVHFKIEFIVEKDGSFSNIIAVGGGNEEASNEAIRVLQTMPKWQPAEHEGQIVRSTFTLPIKIKIKQPSNEVEN